MKVKTEYILVLFKKKCITTYQFMLDVQKFNIQVFPYLLNNFTYAPFTHLVWPKCSNYIMKVKNKSRFIIIQFKKMHNFITIQARRMKFNIQVFTYILNNF